MSRVNTVSKRQMPVYMGQLIDRAYPVIDHRLGGIMPGVIKFRDN